MERQQVADDIISIAGHITGFNPANITEEDTLNDALEMDSLDHVEFIMEMEKNFNIMIDDDKAGKAKTIGANVDLVMEYVKHR